LEAGVSIRLISAYLGLRWTPNVRQGGRVG